jgi:FOG: WD40-like repeat
LQATAGALAIGAVSRRGAAQSQPQATGPTVYVGSSDGALHAVDTTTGEQEWAFTQPSFIVSSPTIADGTIYVGSAESNGANVSGTLHAVNATTGSQEWAFTRAVQQGRVVADGGG